MTRTPDNRGNIVTGEINCVIRRRHNKKKNTEDHRRAFEKSALLIEGLEWSRKPPGN